MKIRTGFGFDVHKLVEGRELWMGGIKLEHSLGLLGHSDADVLIHAICDALLGAANMRDIGYHFPDTSADTLNIDSKILLRKTMDLIATKGYRLGNIDATICAENESAYSRYEGMSRKSDGLRRGRHIHQGHYNGEAGIHRTRGRHQRICHCTDNKRLTCVKMLLKSLVRANKR